MTDRAKKIEECLASWVAQHGCECGHPACKRCRDTREAQAALSTPATEGGDRCPTCLQMPDAYQKGIEDGARGQYRRGVEDAARVAEESATWLLGGRVVPDRIRALAPPATEGATKEEP